MHGIHENNALSNARGLEAAMERDRAFFHRHPFLPEYTREIMPGEFPALEAPVPPDCRLQGLVSVRRISPNVRKRTVLNAMIIRERNSRRRA